MNEKQYMHIATGRCGTTCVSNRRVSHTGKKVYMYVAKKMIQISQPQDPPANDDKW